MTAVRTARATTASEHRWGTVRAVRADPATSTTTIHSDCGPHVVPDLPDVMGGVVATSGLRRTHHVLIVLDGGTATCTVAGITRAPVRRPVSLGAALALVAEGVPAFLVAEG